jgi:coenzyme Q-binding protein COQ10
MPSTRFLERVPHCPDCVMSLVTNVERYPDFIPAMTALRKTKDLDDGFEAEAMINFKGVTETFASRITIDEDARTVTVQKAQRGGPVKALQNHWHFYELSDGSTLIDFEVEVRLMFPLESLLRQKFDKARAVIRNVFVQQALDNCETLSDEPELNIEAEVKKLGLDSRLLYDSPIG